jgi:hypothetical protein
MLFSVSHLQARATKGSEPRIPMWKRATGAFAPDGQSASDGKSVS